MSPDAEVASTIRNFISEARETEIKDLTPTTAEAVMDALSNITTSSSNDEMRALAEVIGL